MRRLFRHPVPSLYAALLLLAAGGLAVAGDGYAWRVAALVGLYATAAIGFQLVFGRLGLLMLAQGTFFGAGAYAAGIAGAQFGVQPWFGIGLGVLAGAMLAVLVAGPVARLESHYVALATLALAQLGLLAVTHGGALTGGSNGLYGLAPLSLFGLEIIDGPALAALAWVAAGTALLAGGLVAGGAARARHATLRDAPLAAASLGIDAARARLLLFPVAGGAAGLAGALQAHGLGVVSPAVMRFDVMVTILAIAVVGGRGSLGGAVAAAALLVPLPEVFRVLEGYYLVAYGVALLAVITLAPEGLDGVLRRLLPEPAGPAPEALPLRLRGSGLRAVGLTKAFGGNRALQDATMSVGPGTLVGLIGPNGSGKTTALNLISGLVRPDAGRLLLGDRDLSALDAVGRARAGLARSFQHPVFPQGLTVLEAAAAGAREPGLAVAALGRVGLDRRWGEPVSALGPADLRLLDLARALATEPGTLLLDEPAAGLSPAERDRLAEVLSDLRAAGLAVLVVEHRMDFLLPLADRVVCLVSGQVVADGAPDAVRADPIVRRAYLGDLSAAGSEAVA